MIKIVYRIETEARDYIERCHYYLQMCTRTLEFILSNPEKFVSLKESTFEKYCDDYMEAYIEYELLSNEILDIYTPSSFSANSVIWALDKSSSTLTVCYVKDDMDDAIDSINIDGPFYLISKEVVTEFDIAKEYERVWKNYD